MGKKIAELAVVEVEKRRTPSKYYVCRVDTGGAIIWVCCLTLVSPTGELISPHTSSRIFSQAVRGSSASLNMIIHPCEYWLVRISVTESAKAYVIRVTWSEGSVVLIYRRYSAFFDFHVCKSF
jgi:hypothetical protein